MAINDKTIDNQVLGRGRLYTQLLVPGTRTPLNGQPERFIGNVSAFTTTRTVSKLDHYSSEQGIKVKDNSVVLQDDMTMKFTTDNVSQANIALWFAGVVNEVSQEANADASETIAIYRGGYYQLGASDDNPTGVRSVSAITVNNVEPVAATGTFTFDGQPTADDTVTIGAASIEFVAADATGAEVVIGASATATAAALLAYVTANSVALGVTGALVGDVLTLTAITKGTAGNAIATAKSGAHPTVSGATLTGGATGTTLDASNYDVDLARARIYAHPDATGFEDGDTVTVNYSVAAATLDRIVTADSNVYCAIRFLSANGVGEDHDYFYPYVSIASDGDMSLIADTWQDMSFTGDVLGLGAVERAYVDGVPQSA